MAGDDQIGNCQNPFATRVEQPGVGGERVLRRSCGVEPEVGENDQAGFGFDQR